MKKIYKDRFKEGYIDTVLDNGLRVILWQKSGYKKSNFAFGTPFGGRDHQQYDSNGNLHTYPAGVAHFLEHKMFEKDGKDVMEEFSSMGANVNAFTSYNETVYYFSTTNDPIKPLHLLLDFVQELTITEASVEKEKGIIVQELEMYKQMSDSRLFTETFSTIFQEHPYKEDIGGSEASVNAITLEILEECYELNYHPSNMILIGVTALQPELVLDQIKSNQQAKTFKSLVAPKRHYVKEPIQVRNTKQTIAMDISTNKVALAYKLPGNMDMNLADALEWQLTCLLEMAFSPLSAKYQEWIDQHIVNDAFGYEVEIGKDYGLIIFSGETNKPELFFDTMKQTIQSMDHFDSHVLHNLKRKYFGDNINSLNSFEAISIGFIRSCFQGFDFFESLERIETITNDDLIAAYHTIDFSNYSEIIITPQN